MSDPVSLILLSAGRGKRMGVSKGLLDYEGKPLCLAQLERYYQWQPDLLAVMLFHPDYPYIEHCRLEAVSGTSEYYSKDFPTTRFLPVSEPDLPQFSTILQGINRLGSQGPCFVQPVDMSPPEISLLQALYTSLKPQSMACIPRFGNNGGHPVLLTKSCLQKLGEVDPKEYRLDWFLKSLPEKFIETIEAKDSEILENWNHREDLG